MQDPDSRFSELMDLYLVTHELDQDRELLAITRVP
jgi:hypothetical protein